MKIILLSYVNRSGSTYLANILSSSDQICVCPEADLLYDHLLIHPDRLLQSKDLIRLNQLFKKDKKFIRWKLEVFLQEVNGMTGWEAFQTILRQFRNYHFPQAEFVLFKHQKLFRLYNAASTRDSNTIFWINISRDPFNIFASQKNTISPSTGKPMTDNPVEFIDFWNEFTSKTSQMSNNSITIPYEELILKPQNWLEFLSVFLNLKIILDIDRISDSKYYKWIDYQYKQIHPNINRAPQIENLDKWKKALTSYEAYTIYAEAQKAGFAQYEFIQPKPSMYSIFLLFLKISRRKKHLISRVKTQLKNSVLKIRSTSNSVKKLLRGNHMIYRIITAMQGWRLHSYFSEVKHILIFIGYPRSGSSTLASLLDSHRNVLISHELDILYYLQKGYHRNQMFYLMIRNSLQKAKEGRYSSGYMGLVETGSNGHSKKLKIVGDKKAGKTSARLTQQPDLINTFQQVCKTPVKCLHIVRNPFDMIATQTIRGRKSSGISGEWDIEKSTSFFFEKLDVISKIKQKNVYDVLDVRLENLIQNPKRELTLILDWLNLENYPGYLESCMEHLFKRPNKTRQKVNWSEDQIRRVHQKIQEISFLAGYQFDD
ncbi:MAG: sulfotransferase [Bacteroidales bacterium]|nr:sulfotransferase [Bacteroidales bacterium]